MKELLLGNAAIARGVHDAGCLVASSYPGTPSTEITECLAQYDGIYAEWAPNEKTAVEVAFGASLAGKRSFSGMKHVGLNVASDPLFTISYTGVNAGFVVCVADDPAMHSSQNEQDSRHYAKAMKIPMLEPADSQECYDYAKLAYELSEEFDTPVFIRTNTRIAHSQSVVEAGERVSTLVGGYEKNAAKYVMMPGNAKARHPLVEQRTSKLRQLAEETPLNRAEMGGREIGVITSGTSYQYVKEAFGDRVSVLKLGIVFPLPEKLILDFAAEVGSLYVVEELDPFIEEHCKMLGLRVSGKDILPPVDEFSQNLVAERLGFRTAKGVSLDEPIPPRPPVMCAGCPHRGIFYALARKKLTVLGDIGCYTLGAVPPLAAMDMTVCMGASVSAMHGFSRAGGKNCVAVIGDSTFMHTGISGLIDIAYNGSDGTVIILDNSITGMTGHQQNPSTGLNIRNEPSGKVDIEALCKAIGIARVRVVDPYDLKECSNAIEEEIAVPGPSVIIARRPCALLKTVKAGSPLEADAEKCTGCSSCMKIGCPAISMKGKKAAVDPTLCVGCGICAGLCGFGALAGSGASTPPERGG